MFYTHFNLEGLKLESIKLDSAHAGDVTNIKLFLKSTSRLGHNFINLKLKSKLISIEQNSFSFTDQSTQVVIKTKNLTRGYENIHQVYFETLFPFHLFRCISVQQCNLEIVVYPELKMARNFQEISKSLSDDSENEELVLKEFALGDSYMRVDWKRLAQTNQWYSKIISTPKNSAKTLVLDEEKDPEEQLSSLAHYIRFYQSQGIPYGLVIKNNIILPETTLFHQQKCLKALAMYEH
jgi:uncharacterized protein (DUF58 family)